MLAKFLFGTSSHIPENYLLIITRHSFMGLIIIIVTIFRVTSSYVHEDVKWRRIIRTILIIINKHDKFILGFFKEIFACKKPQKISLDQ